MAKYVIELEKIEGTNLYRAEGATLVFDARGIKNMLTPYEEDANEEVDWAQVAVDTPILVADCSKSEWFNRYFAKYENGVVYAWEDGRTSWSSGGRTTDWAYAKLAERSENNG